MPANLIILFAKEPVVGQVKTRLIPAITPEFAAELHTAFVRDMIDRFRAFEGTVTRKLQTSGNLGLKMIHALQLGLDSGYERVMIIGSDAPTLPAAHVSALLAADADITFGPAEDGGFYAISARRVHPAMFNPRIPCPSVSVARRSRKERPSGPR